MAILVASVTFMSCTRNRIPEEFLFLNREHYNDLRRVLQEDDYASRYVLMEKFISDLYSNQGSETARSFIQQYGHLYSADPFNSYYFQLLGNYYEDKNSQVSIYFHRQILARFPGVLVQGQSSHLQSIQSLLNLETAHPRRIEYYEHLIQEFPAEIDLGLSWYFLAQEYRSDGRFDDYFNAISLIEQDYPQTSVPGVPDAMQQISEELAFHRNPLKNWSFETLDELETRMRFALRTKDRNLIERYRAKVNFFATSWLQEQNAVNARPDPESFNEDFNIGMFFPRGSVNISLDLARVSDQEALLRTSGWGFRIPVWYFYFRRIEYPADPDIHGNWEWAGIYFGDLR